MNEQDYRRIEAEISSEDSPVGIDARHTHVLILGKLEAIERRLDALEGSVPGGAGASAFASGAKNAAGTAVDALDEEVERLRERGVDLDARLRCAVELLERVTQERTAEAMGRMADALPTIEPKLGLLQHADAVVATATDALDEEFQRLAEHGVDADAALRNGLRALLYLGQRISTAELESLGTLLRSDVLHPSAVEIVGKAGRALVEAAHAPASSVGPIKAVSSLGDSFAKRSTGFLLEFARRFGETLDTDHTHEGRRGEERSPVSERSGE